MKQIFFYYKVIILLTKPISMGRKKKSKKAKVAVVPVYITGYQTDLINKKYGSLTQAVKEKILPELEIPVPSHE